MADTTIRIDTETRDRLALLAEEQGTNVKAIVREWAFLQLTRTEVSERRAKALAYIQENLNPDFRGDATDEAEGDRLWAQIHDLQYGPRQATA
ncbi:hypothetical protein F0L68_13095 [Solihabitans fulvus]|uniref:Ribbon-helix-helix protein, copG family n=1 Tax=Solihabitans fulvus TaxID=1892852 RepID=A0A5B2XH55_9PSEU|nr:hypothetical protein [Solihabitans fulvus]KAA2262221.1 hypothetical protein F0L68_13095 [Solihabitans fulvus]